MEKITKPLCIGGCVHYQAKDAPSIACTSLQKDTRHAHVNLHSKTASYRQAALEKLEPLNCTSPLHHTASSASGLFFSQLDAPGEISITQIDVEIPVIYCQTTPTSGKRQGMRHEDFPISVVFRGDLGYRRHWGLTKLPSLSRHETGQTHSLWKR